MPTTGRSRRSRRSHGAPTADRAARLHRSSWALVTGGVLLLVGVGAWQLNATLWSVHAQRAGHALVRRFLGNHALSAPVTAPGVAPQPTGGSLATCTAGTGGTTGAGQGSTPVNGLLEIPTLGVVAPVEQGVGSAVLDAAVGHDPSSVWPGRPGKAVLEAHDVSYFSGLADLHQGDVIRYVTPCTTYAFTVTAGAVVHEGAPVYDTTGPTLTLVTCWPTDALWLTPDRYLVSAAEVSEAPTAGAPAQYLTAAAPPTVPVPAALAAQGVTTDTYALPMGTFTLIGHPDPAWARTTSPLLAQGSAVEAYIAGVRALTESRLDWWRSIAPGVAPPGALLGAGNPRYLAQMDVVEEASGTEPTAVHLTDTVSVTGGSHPGTYSLAVGEVVHGGTLTISSWRMQPT